MSSDSSAREWKRLEPTEPVTVPRAWSHGAGVGARLSSSVAPELCRRHAQSSEGPGVREDATAAGLGGKGWPMPVVAQVRCWRRSGRRHWQPAGTESECAKQSSSSLGQGPGQGAVPRDLPCCLLQARRLGHPARLRCYLCCQCAWAAWPFLKGGEHSWEGPRCSPGTGRHCVHLPRTE